MHLIFGRGRVPTCHNTPLSGLLASMLSHMLAAGLAARHSQVCLGGLGRLLVWVSVRLLGAGRVDQRSNGGCWAQGVSRGGISYWEAESSVRVFVFFGGSVVK
jgi:hypothetical protein